MELETDHLVSALSSRHASELLQEHSLWKDGAHNEGQLKQDRHGVDHGQGEPKPRL